MELAVTNNCDTSLNWFVIETSRVGAKNIFLPNGHQWLTKVVKPCCDKDIFKVSLTLIKGNCCHPIEALVLCGSVIRFVNFKPGCEESIQSARYHSTRIVYIPTHSQCTDCHCQLKLTGLFVYNGINVKAYHELDSNYVWDISSNKNRFFMKLRKTQCIDQFDDDDEDEPVALNILYFDSFGVYRMSQVYLYPNEEADITPQDMHVNSITGIRDNVHVIFVEKINHRKNDSHDKLTNSLEFSFEFVKSLQSSSNKKFFSFNRCSPIDHVHRYLLQLIAWLLGQVMRKMSKMDDGMFS